MLVFDLIVYYTNIPNALKMLSDLKAKYTITLQKPIVTNSQTIQLHIVFTK